MSRSSRTTDPTPRTNRYAGIAVALCLSSIAAAWMATAPAHADDRDLLRRGTSDPYVFIIFDTSGSMHWSPKCSAEQYAAGICDFLCPTGDCFVPMNADDPKSKFFQAKEALYEVIESAENVEFGFATYNQDQLRVYHKHWLYRATENGVGGDGVFYPAVGAEEVFGAQWDCDTGNGDNNVGCYRTTPADLGSSWELERVQRLAKGGDDLDDNRRVYIRTGGTTFEVTYDPENGQTLGDLTIDVRIIVRRCENNGCNAFVDATTVTYERIGEFIAWDNTANRDNPQAGYFHQAFASGAAADDTCEGLEGNGDRTSDEFNGVNLKFPTTPDGTSDLLDLGDMIPLSWTTDNQSRLLARLAPNRALGEVVPDFSIARYLDDHPGGNGLLELEDGRARPLVAFGSTPLGNSIRDFRTWYAGCASGSCNKQTGWKDLAADNDPDWGCRRTYLLVLSDGDDTCSGPDACSGTAGLFAQEGVKTYVVAFGVENTAGNRLNCMAANGGTGDPIYPQNKEELVNALTNIFSEIQEDARSFASAAVPTVQASVDDKIYLTQFTPLNRSSVWDGHLDAFLEPLPLVPSGPDAGRPDRDRRCEDGHASGCLVWDAGEKLLEQGAAVDLSTDPPEYGMGDQPLERRVFYARGDSAPTVPRQRRLFQPPPDPSDPDDPDTWGAAWNDMVTGFQLPAGAPSSLDEARETVDFLLSTKLVQAKNPDGDDPPEIEIPVLMGDIFHSSPVAVGGPDNLAYFLKDVGSRRVVQGGETVEVGGYQEFALRHRVRRKMVMVGTNDGQLHAFDAGRYSATVETLGRNDPNYFDCFDDEGDLIRPVPVIEQERFDNGTGYEIFSFVPRASMRKLPKLPGSTRHQYTVDSSVTVGDVEIGPVETFARSGEPDYVSAWRSVVVGGLRRGGRGYYALDITQPDRITEELVCTEDGVAQATSVAVTGGDGYVPSCLGDLATGDAPASGCGPRAFPSVLWEFEDTWDENGDGFPDLGDTWSVPVLGRVRVCDGTSCDPGDPSNDIEDRWVAVFGGGFDEDALLEGSGAGSFIYMVDVATGEILYKEEVIGMVPSDPGVVDSDQDGYLDRIYIGTTAGKVYKVNLRKIARLRDVSVSPGPSQPMATVRRVDTSGSADPEWQPFEIFDTGGRPVFYPPSAIFLAEQGRFAVAFGTGDRDDLWRNDPQTGRFFVFLDTDLPYDSPDLPYDAGDLAEIGVDDLNLAADASLLIPASGAPTAGWFLELRPQERLITKPFALSGVLFFTSYLPDENEVPEDQPGGGRNQDDVLCARTGESFLYIVFATNANALAETEGVLQRYRQVPEFVTDPFTTLSSTDNAPVDDGGSGDPGDGPADQADDLCRDLDELGQQLRALFPDSCRFGTYTLDIQTIRSDRGLVCIAPVPVCFQQQNWTEF